MLVVDGLDEADDARRQLAVWPAIAAARRRVRGRHVPDRPGTWTARCA